MTNLNLRKLWRDIHLWIGLSLTIIFIPLGLTGSWLVFDEPFDRMLHPQRYLAASAPADLPPSRYFTAAGQAFGNRAAPAQLRAPEKPGGLVTVVSATGLTAWIDPATATVRDVGAPRKEVRGVMHQLHGNLFLAQPGRKIVGWLGVVMLVSGVTGLIIWWPRNNAVAKALRWRRSPIVWSNIHHMVGFWICVPLVILSFTGTAIAFPDLVRAVSGAPAPPQGGPRGPRGAVPEPIASPRLSADEAVALAREAAGPGRLSQLQVPAAKGRPSWQVTLRGAHGQTVVAVDDRSAAVREQHSAPQRQGSRDPLMRAMRGLHDGGDIGLAWQVLIFVAGLTPAILGVTGVLIWMRGLRRPARAGRA